jgi:hypothetical protein
VRLASNKLSRLCPTFQLACKCKYTVSVLSVHGNNSRVKLLFLLCDMREYADIQLCQLQDAARGVTVTTALRLRTHHLGSNLIWCCYSGTDMLGQVPGDACTALSQLLGCSAAGDEDIDATVSMRTIQRHKDTKEVLSIQVCITCSLLCATCVVVYGGIPRANRCLRWPSWPFRHCKQLAWALANENNLYV